MAARLPHLETILEDDHLVAVIKPAGLPTANAPRGAPSAFMILRDALPAGGFLGVVSRLDAAVSGVLVMAKTRTAAAELSRQFREREVAKFYGAVVEGRFPAPLGQWVDWHDRIERQGQERRSMLRPRSRHGPVPPQSGGDAFADDDPDGAGADLAGACHVRARVVRRCGEVSLVDLEPSTGRRHQLRAQLAGHGCPIVGDRVYGARLPFLAADRSAIALHARSIGFVHPTTGRAIELCADWPVAWRTRFPGLLAHE
jgi:23S rRNA-/tRNA-specific pseudouridylate synthase